MDQNIVLNYEAIFEAIKKELDDPKEVDSVKIMSWIKVHCVGLSFDDGVKLALKLRKDLWEA